MRIKNREIDYAFGCEKLHFMHRYSINYLLDRAEFMTPVRGLWDIIYLKNVIFSRKVAIRFGSRTALYLMYNSICRQMSIEDPIGSI